MSVLLDRISERIKPFNPSDQPHTDGRYIPYGGGCLGWYENSGIPHVELSNNYRVHLLMDPQRIHQVSMRRIETDNDRREVYRINAKAGQQLNLVHRQQLFTMSLLDTTLRGVRGRIAEAEISFEPGELVHLLPPGESLENLTFKTMPPQAIEARVVWAHRVPLAERMGFTHRPALPPPHQRTARARQQDVWRFFRRLTSTPPPLLRARFLQKADQLASQPRRRHSGPVAASKLPQANCRKRITASKL